jgi:RNA polymerase sigma-70 factor (ECF subfamily)
MNAWNRPGRSFAATVAASGTVRAAAELQIESGDRSMADEVATHASDRELVDRARGGDEAAFRVIVERYEPRVAATVVGMLGPGDEAEDVGQETFIRLYRSLDRFRGDASLGTYLTRIAINRSLTALRRRRRWTSRFVRKDDGERELPDAAGDLRTEIDREDDARRVHRAIDRLSPDHRAVVVLRMIDGCSTREAAAILGVPPGTVMSRLARALGRLESELKEFER